MFLIRTLLSQGTILCIILLLVTLDVGFSTGKPTAKPYVIPLVLAGCLLLFGGMELLCRGNDPAGEVTAGMFFGWLGLLGAIGSVAEACGSGGMAAGTRGVPAAESTLLLVILHRDGGLFGADEGDDDAEHH